MNSSNNNGNNNNPGNSNQTGWAAKVGYIGTGVAIGLLAYPFVKKMLTHVQPKMDKLLDDLTGKAENVAEKASDLFAKAKSSFTQAAETTVSSGNGNAHSHPHANAPAVAEPKDV